VRRALVTGGAGFIGSHLVEALAARGERVRVFDNFSTGRRENLPRAAGVEVIEGDLRDLAAVREACRGVDLVFHEGALASVPRSVEDPLTTEAVNGQGTLHALLAAREAGVARFLFAGSSSVYGDDPRLPKEEGAPLEPISPYGASKAVGELYCRAFARVYGTPTVVLRYFNVFGPRQRGDSPYSGVIARFADALLRGEEVTIEGDGEQTRDFTFVADVVAANLLAADAALEPGTVLNVAAGRETSVRALFETMREILGAASEPRRAPARAGDISRSRASIDRARALLGFEPSSSLRDGLARTLAWYREAAR
jgi:nucleoside-diphosphate-sugar epimerase